MRQLKRSWCLDLVFCALGVIVLLDRISAAGPSGEPDEGRYAEIPREMLATGDFVTPRLDGVKYFEKPPLFYWVEAGASRLFGPSEWALRLVPAFFALGRLPRRLCRRPPPFRPPGRPSGRRRPGDQPTLLCIRADPHSGHGRLGSAHRRRSSPFCSPPWSLPGGAAEPLLRRSTGPRRPSPSSPRG